MSKIVLGKRKASNKQKVTTNSIRQVVKRANRTKNLLDKFPSEQLRYVQNGLNLTVIYDHASNLDAKIISWAFELTKSNMKALYEGCSWGWNDKEKLSQLTHRMSHFLVAVDEENEPKAFVNFRFDTDYDDPVLYCYEIQLECAVQRKGVGMYLMDLLHQIAKLTDMKKVKLTVLKENESAFRFYLDSCKFKIDFTSPSVSKEDECYEILSKVCN